MTFAPPRLIRKHPFIAVFLGSSSTSGDRQRCGGRNQQKRRNESAGKDGGGFTDRSDSEHSYSPWAFSCCWTRPPGPCQYQCTGRAKPKKHLFFSASGLKLWKSASNRRR